jgi:hypothetical protein
VEGLFLGIRFAKGFTTLRLRRRARADEEAAVDGGAPITLLRLSLGLRFNPAISFYFLR